MCCSCDPGTLRLSKSCGFNHAEAVKLMNYGSSSHETATVWKRMIWKRLKLDKKKGFGSTADAPCYNANTYSQNFDHGFVWDEPDCLSRSFSMRFACPSKKLDD
ncbi:hypothetical protein Droror1_Dr00007407 [Drosera rotundifolia]